MAKTIQIAAVPATETSGEALYALQDDGSIWVRSMDDEKVWLKIAEIPNRTTEIPGRKA